METCLTGQVRAYPGLRVDVATDVDHVLEGLCVSRRHGQLRVAMGAQKGRVPSRHHAALDQPGFSGLQDVGQLRVAGHRRRLPIRTSRGA